jgi:hypothetical protein
MADKEAKQKKDGQAQNALARPTTGELAAFGSIQGLEQVGQEDIQLPQLVVAQGLSPCVAAGQCKPGDMIDSVMTDQVVPRGQRLEFVPVMHFKRRVKWLKMEEGGGIDCRSKDAVAGDTYGACADCEHAEWREKTQEDKGAPLCTKYQCFLGFRAGGPQLPLIVDLAKTKEKAAKAWLSMLTLSAMAGGRPIWDSRYALETFEDTQKNGGLKFWNVRVTKVGPSSEEDRAFAATLYEQFKGSIRKVAIDHEREEKAAPSGGDKDI